jgi:predicted component of type VI protein secretion system
VAISTGRPAAAERPVRISDPSPPVSDRAASQLALAAPASTQPDPQPGSRRTARLGTKLEIGSSVGAHGLLLPERGISRLHATITRHLGRLMLHDPGSTNGTYSALGRVFEVALRLGARFRIGSYEPWVEEPRGEQGQPDAPAGKQVFAGMISGDPAVHRLFAAPVGPRKAHALGDPAQPPAAAWPGRGSPVRPAIWYARCCYTGKAGSQ